MKNKKEMEKRMRQKKQKTLGRAGAMVLSILMIISLMPIKIKTTTVIALGVKS